MSLQQQRVNFSVWRGAAWRGTGWRHRINIGYLANMWRDMTYVVAASRGW